MASSGNQADVAALLRSLTAYLPANQTSVQGGPSNLYSQDYPTSANGQTHLENRILQDSAYVQGRQKPIDQLSHNGVGSLTQSGSGSAVDQPKIDETRQTPSSTTPAPQPSTQVPPPPNPQTIVAWPAALRYVTKLTGQDDYVIERVRKTIDNQHFNERQWWEGRQALLAKQAARVEGRQKLDEVLRAVGVQASQDQIPVTDEKAELRRYDLKVHKAQVKMAEATRAELQSLRIPFFGTMERVIIEDGASESGKISRSQLLKLQGKMMAFLEELCKD